MAEAITIEIQGLDQLKKKFSRLPRRVIQRIESAMSLVADDFVNRAVEDAPVDQGILRNEITKTKVGELQYKIVSGASWSAFIEFGTRSRVQVPSTYADYAAQFKSSGKGGGSGFFDMILDWVKRKGITGTYSVKTHRRLGSGVDRQVEDEQIAFAIYLSILRHGIRPHPYFFKQLPQAQSDLNKELEGVVAKSLEK